MYEAAAHLFAGGAVAEVIPRDEHDRWMLISHSALNGDWPALVMQKGNEAAVYKLLMRLKQGN